jgi:hypothetical protein
MLAWDGSLLAVGAGLGGALTYCLVRPAVPPPPARADTKPYIAVVKDGSPEAAADAGLSQAYALVRNSDGSMDNVMTIHSLNPATMHAHAALYTQCMKGHSPLSKADREIVAVAASRSNRCTY